MVQGNQSGDCFGSRERRSKSGHVGAAINETRFSLASGYTVRYRQPTYRHAVLGYRGLGRSDRCTTQTRRISHTPHTFV
jgi:hypothetical protein